MNMIDSLVGKRIRARRQALRVSQAELGKAIGVRFQQIQKYESGTNRVSASRLWAIADVLGVDVVHFFEGIRSADSTKTGIEATPTDDLAFLTDRETLEMVDLYRSLPAPQKHAVLSFVRTMTQTGSDALLSAAR